VTMILVCKISFSALTILNGLTWWPGERCYGNFFPASTNSGRGIFLTLIKKDI